MNILVTGGAGNVGSALVKGLLRLSEVKILVVDNLSTGNIAKVPLDERVKFIKSDANSLEDMMSIILTNNFDYIFHYAAVVGVQRTLSNPISVLNDIEGIKNILQIAKNSGVKRVFYSSSSEVYGEPVSIPQHEITTPLNSKLPYAIVKNIGEAYCRSFWQEYNLPFTIFRFFNTYGPNQSDDFVMPRFIKRALRNEDIDIYGDGQQSRTFCWVDDNIDATINSMLSNECINKTLNIGSEVEVSIKELAELIVTISKSKSIIKYLPALPEGDMARRQPDITEMKKLLDRPLVSLENGIQLLIDYYREYGN